MTAILSVWLRYVVLFVARAMGATYRLLFGAWHRTLLTLGVVWGLLVSVDRLGDGLPLDRGNVGEVAMALAVVAVVRWAWLARKRLIIANFVDYTGDEPKAAPGMSTLLQVELARLYDLIRLVDDERAVPEAVKGPQNASFAEDKNLEEAEEDRSQITNERLDLPAPIRAEDVTNVLDAAVSIEASMTVGPVRIPVGALASLLGRVAQGPRLVGSIHRTGDQLVVSARTVGDKVGHTWRVDHDLALDDAGLRGPNAAAGEPTVRPEDLLDQLAVRILTDLALQGSARWQATWAYVDGLRAYRESLRTKKDRRLNLERAKDCLLRTVTEDDRFDLAHYNLGVVATDLQQWDAAEAAFLAAIERNPARWDPYYGLAQLYFVRGRYPEMLPLCGRMIRLREHRAESFHLRALANRRSNNVPEAMADRRAAVRWAWFRLCWAAVKGRESKAASVAGTSLRNLAVIRAYQAKEGAREASRRQAPAGRDGTEDDDGAGKPGARLTLAYIAAGWELRQGMFLNASDAELHFELGKVYAARRRWRAAARQLERAVEIRPDRPRFWVQLARAYAGPLCVAPGRRGPGGAVREELWRKALAASERAYQQPSQLADSGFDRLLALHATVTSCDVGAHGHSKETDEQLHRLGQLLQVRDFETRRREWNDGDPRDEELEAELGALTGDALWEDVQVSLELARRYLQRSEREQKGRVDFALRITGRLLDRMEKLHRFHRPEVKRQDVYATIARVLHAAGRSREALPHAQRAVRYDPLSYEARTALAEIELTLGHLAEAETAWRRALVAEPERPYPIFRLGESLVRMALECHAAERRCSMLEEATDHFRTALDLVDLQGPAEESKGAASPDPLAKGQVAYWLGRALFDLDRYEEATTELQLAIRLGYQTPLARLRLGVAYVRMGHFCEGEREFEQILADAGPPRRKGGRRMVGPPGDELSWRAVQVWARIYRAGAHIDRDAGVKEAIGEIEDVGGQIEDFPPAERGAFRAVCADWEGWGWFRLNEPDRAIERLTRSVDLEPTGEAYLHLALVHAHRAGYGRLAEQRRRDEDRARHYAELAGRMGLGVQQRKPLDDMLRQLDAAKELRATSRAQARKSQPQPVA
jgi:tetratricopeptide (TPR) repeat protein